MSDPRNGGNFAGGGLYSDRLKTNVRFDQNLKRNVLEITFDRNVDANYNIDEVNVHKLLTRNQCAFSCTSLPDLPWASISYGSLDGVRCGP